MLQKRSEGPGQGRAHRQAGCWTESVAWTKTTATWSGQATHHMSLGSPPSTGTGARHEQPGRPEREGTAMPCSQISGGVICWGWGHPARKRGSAGTRMVCTLALGRTCPAGASQAEHAAGKRAGVASEQRCKDKEGSRSPFSMSRMRVIILNCGG